MQCKIVLKEKSTVNGCKRAFRRKVLKKGERHNCTKSRKCGAIQRSLGKKKRTTCNYTKKMF